MGDDATEQPGSLQELMLHETAVAWIRWRLAQTVPKQAWLETEAEYESRIKKVVDDINQHLDVAGLCHRLPERVDKLVLAKGDRLKE